MKVHAEDHQDQRGEAYVQVLKVQNLNGHWARAASFKGSSQSN